jgi:monofunctional biosynthetic peptidoglycan transglycosylase
MHHGTKKRKAGSALFALVFASAFLSAIMLYHIPIVLDIFALRFVHPVSTSFMRFNALSHPFTKTEYKWVSAKNISGALKQAVITAEDDRFYKHFGIDWPAVRKAMRVNWKKKRFVRGGSTISQQLVKNLYCTPIKDPVRKVREAPLALLLDVWLPKERILELYLNVAEWGPNVYGAEAASRHYFKKPAINLTISEAAFLASILPNPKRLGKRGFRMSNRASSILGRME